MDGAAIDHRVAGNGREMRLVCDVVCAGCKSQAVAPITISQSLFDFVSSGPRVQIFGRTRQKLGIMWLVVGCSAVLEAGDRRVDAPPALNEPSSISGPKPRLVVGRARKTRAELMPSPAPFHCIHLPLSAFLLFQLHVARTGHSTFESGM
jgi:hypothetical protein